MSGEMDVTDVEYVSLFDLAHQGEIGIYTDHEKLNGAGRYLIYNNQKINESFLYSVDNNQIDIFLI